MFRSPGILLGLLFLSSNAFGGLITDPAGPVIVDFDQFAGSGYNFQFGPVEVKNGISPITVTWTSVGGQGGGGVLGQGNYGLTGNGNWGAGNQTYTGVDNGLASITMVFSSPVAAVSAFLNYAPGGQ